MKNIFVFTSALFLALCIVSCEKSKDFIADNTTETGKGYRPVCGNTLQYMNSFTKRSISIGTSSSGATAFPADTTFHTELQFFSQSPIKQFELYNTVGSTARTLVGTWPYKAAFSETKRIDTLLVPYTMPSVASGTVIKLEYDIVNENGLKLLAPRTVYVKVK